MDKAATIAAISTPAGEGGIGIVRISGPEAVSIADRIFRATDGSPLRESPSHTVHHGWAYNRESKPLDETLAIIMLAPRSFTGEDVVEIHGHGGQVVLTSILEAALVEGARLAEPGEFTRRAFINGRIDLSQAEAVIELIRAKTEEAGMAVLPQLSGRISSEIKAIKDKLLDLVAELEASMDFDEEDEDFMSVEDLSPGIGNIATEIEALLKGSRAGALYREGLEVVIAGRPNVGKSSLFNALLEMPRAIVTPHPGTTRDTVEGCLNLKGIPVYLFDCAGIREAECVIEEEGVKRSVNQIMTSPLVILVLDHSEGLTEEDRRIFRLIGDKSGLVVINKTDLPGGIDEEELGELLPGKTLVRVSCLRREGFEELKEALLRQATSGIKTGGASGLTVNMRHRDVLRRSADLLSASLKAVREGLPVDAVSSDLRLALNTLGEITGETATEDILDSIFRNFCIGK